MLLAMYGFSEWGWFKDKGSHISLSEELSSSPESQEERKEKKNKNVHRGGGGYLYKLLTSECTKQKITALRKIDSAVNSRRAISEKSGWSI